MTKSYDEFVALREDGTKSFGAVMDIAAEKRLFDNMTVEEIRALHKAGYIPGMVASSAIKYLGIIQENKQKVPATVV